MAEDVDSKIVDATADAIVDGTEGVQEVAEEQVQVKRRVEVFAMDADDGEAVEEAEARGDDDEAGDPGIISVPTPSSGISRCSVGAGATSLTPEVRGTFYDPIRERWIEILQAYATSADPFDKMWYWGVCGPCGFISVAKLGGGVFTQGGHLSVCSFGCAVFFWECCEVCFGAGTSRSSPDIGVSVSALPVFAALVWDWYQVLLQGLTLVDVCALTWVRLLDQGLGSWEGGSRGKGEFLTSLKTHKGSAACFCSYPPCGPSGGPEGVCLYTYMGDTGPGPRAAASHVYGPLPPPGRSTGGRRWRSLLGTIRENCVLR